jgi:phosphatidylserine synthase
MKIIFIDKLNILMIICGISSIISALFNNVVVAFIFMILLVFVDKLIKN